MKTTKYQIDALTKTSVSIDARTIASIEVEGETKEIELNNNRKAYVNTVDGRVELQAEMPVDVVNAVLTYWGDVLIPEFE